MMKARVLRALGSLKFKLGTAAVMSLLLGIGASTAVLVQRAQSDTVAEHSVREVAEAARISRLLARQVVAQQNALALLAESLPPETLAEPATLRRKLKDKPWLLTQFDSIGLWAASGRGILGLERSGGHAGAELFAMGELPDFERALRERRPLVSEPVVSPLGTDLVVLLTQPLPHNGGVVAGALRLRQRHLLDGLADGRDAWGQGDGPVVVLTDPKGRILAHHDPEMIGAPISAEPSLAAAVRRWRDSGSPIEPAGLDVSDSEHLVAVAGVAGPDWLVWRSTPRSTVLAPLVRARSEALLWALGLTLALSLGLLAWMALLLRPLARLEARAERLFDGSLDPQAGWPRTGGEIGRLERVLRHVGAERAQLESFNHSVIQRLQSVMAAAPVGIAFTREQRFELVSRQFCHLLGRNEAQLLGQPAQLIFVSNEDYLRLGAEVVTAFGSGQLYAGEWQLLRPDGSRVWARLRAQPVDAAEAHCGTIWTANDITQEISERQALEWAATHDPLTGLGNRAAFDQRVTRLYAALPRSLPAALVVLDLDRFKPINDQHGHAAGDAMLRAIATAASQRVRPGDLLVRLGGDEFAVVLERCSAEVAARVAEDLRAAICGVRLPWEGRLLDVGASAGVAMLTDAAADPAAWLATADRACYEAKAAGRGRVQHSAGGGPATLRLVVDKPQALPAEVPAADPPQPAFQSSQS